MLKLKLQYLGHLMQRVGRDWGQEEKGTIEDEMDGWLHGLDAHELGEFRDLVMNREAWRTAIHGVLKSRTRLSG